MKAIRCEMCFSTDLVKQDGMFVCQSCGTKYAPEEARKLMVEIDGKVDVTGSTVKVDNSDELANLYVLARRAKDDNNSENAEKYYNQIIIKDPSSWEANFYAIYYNSMNCTIGNIENAAIKLCNCEDTILKLIKENVLDEKERYKAVDEIGAKLISIAGMLFNAAKNHYDDIDYSIRSDYTQEMLDRCCAARDILYNFGDYLIAFFGEIYGEKIAVPCWQLAIEQHKTLLWRFERQQVNREIINEYISKINQYKPSCNMPLLEEPKVETSNGTTSSGGCYVATCVYGSYDCPEVWTLRRYRDDTLGSTWYGRLFIRLYYAISPTIVKWFGETKWFKKMWKGKLDRMVKNLQEKGVESTPYKDKDWTKK